MLYFIFKAALSGMIIAAISTVSKRYPGFGALIASLPLISVLGMIWLWRDRPDATNMAEHAQATFWFVLPSLPMFLAIPAMLRAGIGFWTSLVVGCLLTIALYGLMVWLGPRVGIRLRLLPSSAVRRRAQVAHLCPKADYRDVRYGSKADGRL